MGALSYVWLRVVLSLDIFVGVSDPGGPDH